MGQKRSIGITFFGSLVIFTSSLAVLGLDLHESLIMLQEPWGTILYMATMPLALFEIILGVSVLRLKDWARKALIILSMIHVMTFVTLPILVQDNLWLFLRKKFENQITDPSMAYILIGGYVAYNLLIIFFFTRPKVKWQFWSESNQTQKASASDFARL